MCCERLEQRRLEDVTRVELRAERRPEAEPDERHEPLGDPRVEGVERAGASGTGLAEQRGALGAIHGATIALTPGPAPGGIARGAPAGARADATRPAARAPRGPRSVPPRRAVYRVEDDMTRLAPLSLLLLVLGGCTTVHVAQPLGDTPAVARSRPSGTARGAIRRR